MRIPSRQADRLDLPNLRRRLDIPLLTWFPHAARKLREGPVVKDEVSNRRAHRRIPSSELREATLIRIPDHPAVSLVDLSSGGALLELPFQLRPEARVTLQLFTSAEQFAIPFQLLRCYVADLREGVRYHAAGAFHHTLRLPAALTGESGPAAPNRLLTTLEGFLRASQGTDLSSRGERFNELLTWVVVCLRHGDPADLISIQIREQLTRLFPSLVILPASPVSRDASTTARFFGLDFRSNKVLTAADRRFLRASAQLITLLDREANLVASLPPDAVVHSVGEWQTLRNVS
jgi:PilZ domain